MQSVIAELARSLVALPAEFATVAGADPVAALLLAVGALITIVTMAVGGVLAGGALLAYLLSVSTGPTPGRAGG